MSFQIFMTKVKNIDNQIAKWMMGHFYILFFQIFLVFIFLLAFINILKIIDLNNAAPPDNTLEQIALVQASNSNLTVVLLLLNSFWMLFIFSGLIRIRSILKDINFNLLRGKSARDSA